MTYQNVSTKTCFKCKETKVITEFDKDSSRKDGCHPYCKICKNIFIRAYIRTKKGLLTKIYGQQQENSRVRGHGIPEYSLTELREWAFKQPLFDKLYGDWVSAKFSTMLSPSVDRLDDYKAYSFDNIRLVTWQENNNKGHFDRKNGLNNKHSKPIIQLTSEGIIMREFYSRAQASRDTGIPRSSIWACCKGKLKTAGGYVWCYA